MGSGSNCTETVLLSSCSCPICTADIMVVTMGELFIFERFIFDLNWSKMGQAHFFPNG